MKLLILLCALILVCCSKLPDPTPGPTPVPTPSPSPKPVITEFRIEGKLVVIEGKLKPGSKLTVEEAKKALQLAADLIDRQ